MTDDDYTFDYEDDEDLEDEVSDEPTRGGLLIAMLVPLGAALLLYLPTYVSSFGYGFVNYDDPELISSANPAIGQGLFAGLPDLLNPFATPQFMYAWLPLYYWSIGLDHAVFGNAAWGYHLHSTILHGIGAALVALIGARLGLRTVTAAVAGVLFAVHPVATENVVWVASRKDALSFIWMAAAALFYLAGVQREGKGTKFHLVGAACLFISMLAKGTTVVLPLLLGVHAWLLADGAKDLDADGSTDYDLPTFSERLKPITPYAIVAVLMAGLHYWVGLREGPARGSPFADAGIGDLLMANLNVAWHYVLALCLPFQQSVEWGVVPGHADLVLHGPGALVVLLWGAGIWLSLQWSRPTAAVLVAVLLALSPFNNILPRTTVLFAERYCYVALMPLAIGVAAALCPRYDDDSVLPVRLPTIVAVGMMVALSALRMPDWKNATTLWSSARDVAPESALVQLQLAQALQESGEGEPGEAERAFREAQRVARTELERLRAETGLGSSLLITAAAADDPRAQLEEAVRFLRQAEERLDKVKALGRDSQRFLILSNRGTAHELLGDMESAKDDWERAARADPESALAQTALARVFVNMGRTEEALQALDRSWRLAPDEPQVARDRARIRLVLGDVGGAKADLASALEEHPDDIDLLLQAGRIDALLMRPVDAEDKLRRAMELAPDNELIRSALAAALMEQAQALAARDDVGAARKAAADAAEVAPGSSAPEQILGIVSRRAGDLVEAVRHFRRAFELHREGVRIREALVSVLVEQAVSLLDERNETGDRLRESEALTLLEEAVQVGSSVISTPGLRLDVGVSGWPIAPGSEERAARDAGLIGLAYLAVGRTGDAVESLSLAEIGTRGVDLRLRAVVLQLYVRALFLTGQADAAVKFAAELPGTLIALPGPGAWEGTRQHAAAMSERGVLRRGTGNYEGAQADFAYARQLLTTARENGMPKSRYHLMLGEILFAEERFLEATREFDEATKLDPDDPEPYLDRAAVWRSQYLMEEDPSFLRGADDELRRALGVAPSDPRVLAGLGEVLVMQRKPSEAFPWLQRAVLADPSQMRARLLLAELAVRAGRTHLEKDQVKAARAAADRAVALDPPAPVAWIFMAEVRRAEGDWKAALAELELARERFPESPQTADALAKFYSDLGHAQLLENKHASAIEAFRRALSFPEATIDLDAPRERLKTLASLAFRDGVELDRAGDLEKARAQFALSVYADPTAAGYVALGISLGRLERHADAAEAYTKALVYDTEHEDALLNRGAEWMRLGRLDDAEADYLRWQEIAPAADDNRAGVQYQLKLIREVRAEIDGELEKTPDGEPGSSGD